MVIETQEVTIEVAEQGWKTQSLFEYFLLMLKSKNTRETTIK